VLCFSHFNKIGKKLVNFTDIDFHHLNPLNVARFGRVHVGRQINMTKLTNVFLKAFMGTALQKGNFLSCSEWMWWQFITKKMSSHHSSTQWINRRKTWNLMQTSVLRLLLAHEALHKPCTHLRIFFINTLYLQQKYK
jgi:hypothetical protein